MVRSKYSQVDLLLKPATTAGFIFFGDLPIKTIRSKRIFYGFESCQGSTPVWAIAGWEKLSENNSFGELWSKRLFRYSSHVA